LATVVVLTVGVSGSNDQGVTVAIVVLVVMMVQLQNVEIHACVIFVYMRGYFVHDSPKLLIARGESPRSPPQGQKTMCIRVSQNPVNDERRTRLRCMFAQVRTNNHGVSVAGNAVYSFAMDQVLDCTDNADGKVLIQLILFSAMPV
jgi:hypothetical protein